MLKHRPLCLMPTPSVKVFQPGVPYTRAPPQYYSRSAAEAEPKPYKNCTFEQELRAQHCNEFSSDSVLDRIASDYGETAMVALPLIPDASAIVAEMV
jgi:hypothetical protein